jgi:hypothetical protein
MTEKVKFQFYSSLLESMFHDYAVVVEDFNRFSPTPELTSLIDKLERFLSVSNRSYVGGWYLGRDMVIFFKDRLPAEEIVEYATTLGLRAYLVDGRKNRSEGESPMILKLKSAYEEEPVLS